MRIIIATFLAFVMCLTSTGCSAAQNKTKANSDCVWISVGEFAQNPRPWTGKTICTSGALYKNDDYHSYLFLNDPGGDKLPAGVTIFLASFKDSATESILNSQSQGKAINVAADLSIFEDCWEAEEAGEIEDPCLPARKPIFLDDVELLSLDQ